MAEKYSASSRASINAALTHWDVIRAQWGWGAVIQTGDEHRGGKLCTFVLHLMSHEVKAGEFYPASTISNYVWALCAHFQERLQVDPRVNIIGWSFFMSAVSVMTFVPYEPRRRLPTSVIRSALGSVDRSNQRQVQMALLILMLYFTFQRSEFPCPKTYDGIDPQKHCLVRHMEPHEGGTRWAIGTTKADPRAERLTSDAGPGREWIVIGQVDDALFDMRVWLCLFLSFFPAGPRDPDSPFFVAKDLQRPLIYREALAEYRDFLRGHVPDPGKFGLHGVRSEGFVVCSNSVGEEAAVIQGGWRGITTASRYDRLTPAIARSMAPRMVAFSDPRAARPDGESEAVDDDASHVSMGDSSGPGGLGIVAARRATARVRVSSSSAPPRPAAAASSSSSPPRSAAAASSSSNPSPCFQPAGLPAGWRREWHATSGRRAGYADYVGPCGRRTRSIEAAVALAAQPPTVPSDGVPAAPPPRVVVRDKPTYLSKVAGATVVSVESLVDHVTEFDRPPSRPKGAWLASRS